MKWMLFTLLFLSACNCRSVPHTETVVSKRTEPSTIGICMPIKSGNITTYMPIRGGICAGSIELIPARYYLTLSNLNEISVGEDEYQRSSVGGSITYSRYECP